MFDFLKDLYLQASGLDLTQIEKERKEKIESEKADTILLKPKSKKYLFIAGTIFIIINIIGIVIAGSFQNVGLIVKSGLMIGFTVAAILCSLIKRKTTEILCIVFCVVVVLLSVAMPNF